MGHVLRLFQEGISFLLALVGPAIRSVRENAGLALLSVVLAFGLWIFVADTGGETREGVLPVDLEVEPIAVLPDVALADELITVRPRISVARDEWENLTAVDFEATVNLEGRKVGVYDLPVEVKALTSRGGLRVIGSEPEEIEVRLEPLFSKSVPVVVEVKGKPPSGFTMSPPEPEQETVLVAGSEERVNLVKQVVASLDISGRSEPVEQAVRLEPRDQRGFLVVGVSLEPSIMGVSINIERTRFSATLPIRAEIRGAPAEGYNVVAVTVNPSAVTIFGSQSLIQETTVIPTQPVDISGERSDMVRSVSLDLPMGAIIMGSADVIVTVRIEPGSGEMTFVVPVNVTGLKEGLSVVGTLPSVEVVLLGPLPMLLDVRPDDITVTLNLSGLEAGTHTVRVTVTVPVGLGATSVSPEEIQVQLEQQQSEEQ